MDDAVPKGVPSLALFLLVYPLDRLVDQDRHARTHTERERERERGTGRDNRNGNNPKKRNVHHGAPPVCVLCLSIGALALIT